MFGASELCSGTGCASAAAGARMCCWRALPPSQAAACLCKVRCPVAITDAWLTPRPLLPPAPTQDVLLQRGISEADYRQAYIANVDHMKYFEVRAPVSEAEANKAAGEVRLLCAEPLRCFHAAITGAVVPPRLPMHRPPPPPASMRT